jgi:sec-independent protein translocase protein TatA
MFGFGVIEIILIAVVLILFFGPKKIPELVKSISGAVRNLKGAFKNTKDKDI